MLTLKTKKFEPAMEPVSPYLEMGAYEALWLEKGASFKTINTGYTGTSNLVPVGLFTEDEKFRLAIIRNSNSCVLYDVEQAFLNIFRVFPLTGCKFSIQKL